MAAASSVTILPDFLDSIRELSGSENLPSFRGVAISTYHALRAHSDDRFARSDKLGLHLGQVRTVVGDIRYIVFDRSLLAVLKAAHLSLSPFLPSSVHVSDPS